MPTTYATVASVTALSQRVTVVDTTAQAAQTKATAAATAAAAAQASANAAQASATSAAAAAATAQSTAYAALTSIAAADALASSASTKADAAEAKADLARNDGPLFMPAIVPENGPAVMTLSRGVRLFTSYAKEPFTLIWDPKELYVGWTIAGCVAGAGTVTFMGAPGTTVTLRDVSGAIIPMGQPAVFQGGYGFMVCTERSDTHLVIQTVLGSLGVQSLHVLPDIQTDTVMSLPGSTNVMSYTEHDVDYIFNPELFSPQGYERRFLQVGSGSLTLKGKEGTALIFISLTGEVLREKRLAQGESLKVLCISQSAASATLQILP